MGWREDVKFGIIRPDRFFLGSTNGGMGTEVTATAAELNTMDGITASVTELNSLDVSAAAVSAEHGAGAIGTGVAPVTRRWSDRGHIITDIEIDLTGLACKGDAADDVIGLAAGGVAYIGRYVTASYGIVYKSELILLEAPGEGTATITSDINVVANSSGTLEYDGAASNTYIHDAGTWTAGKVLQNLTPALTANDYLYLTEGDNAATTGEYNAGQCILRFYGHAILA